MDAQTFLKNFATIAETPGGVQRLRELVLDLAAAGVLSNQSTADKPLSVPEMVPADDRPVELPDRWAWAKLGSLGLPGERATADGPFGSKLKTSDYVDQREFRVLRLGNIGSGYFKDADQSYISQAHFESLATYHLRPGDVLVASLGNPCGRACLVPAHVLPALNKADCFRVRAHTEVDPAFLVQVLNAPGALARARDLNRGDTRGRITLAHLKETPVPLPPLAEQKRIVETVDEFMLLCDELEVRCERRHRATTRLRASALHALTESATADDLRHAWDRISAHWSTLTNDVDASTDIRQTILQLAVQGRLVNQDSSDGSASAELERAKAAKSSTSGLRRQPSLPTPETPLARLPSGWTWASVDDMFLVTGGIQKSSKRMPRANHWPYLRVANVQRGRLDLREIERFELFDGELDRLRLQPGDLLVVEGNGSESEIGRCARWDGEIEDCVHQNHLIRCRPMLPGVEHYLLLFLNSPTGMETMKRLAVTTSGLYNLSVGKIRSICFPLPPLAEQERIRQRVDELLRSCDELSRELAMRSQVREVLAESFIDAMAP